MRTWCAINCRIDCLNFTFLCHHMLVTEKYWQTAYHAIIWSPWFYLVACHRKLSGINLFVVCLCFEMFYGSENLVSLVETPQFQFIMNFGRGNVSLCVILVLRAVQSRMMFRTVISKKWTRLVYQQVCHQWTDEAWCLLHSFVFSNLNFMDL